MKIKYPKGSQPNYTNISNTTKLNKKNTLLISQSNRGIDFEEDVNLTNRYYLENDIALIYKRPTPVKVLKFNKKTKRIVEGLYDEKSTTDYNGVYKGFYIDFEVKTTKDSTSFPLSNIRDQQLIHLSRVIENKGIGFFLIRLELLNEVYILMAQDVINFIKENSRHSIPFSYIKEKGFKVEYRYTPRLDYLFTLERDVLNSLQ